MGERPEIRDGGEWIDHEDLLVANEEGLRRLRDACDIALRIANKVLGVVLLAILAVFVIGLWTVARWVLA